MAEEAPEPLNLIYNGTGFDLPSPFWVRRADKYYVIGQRYRMTEVQERNMGKHAAYFATVAEAWANLPDELAAQYPSPDSLRYRALISTGYCTQQTVTVSSKAEARRIAMFFQPDDKYSIVVAKGSTVIKYKAMSQRVRAMGAKTFSESADAVLAWICQLLGVTLEQLKAHSGNSGDGKR